MDSHSRQLRSACVAIGNEVSDADGFVSVRALLKRFNAKLLLRPLLVEGMFAALNEDEDADWGVLIDSERHPFTYDSIETERRGNSLPGRMRYTIAHELAHSMGFRPTEFGIQITARQGRKQSNADFVKQVERQTDAISPLLLCSEATLDTIIKDASGSTVTPLLLEQACRSFGLSRPVLINRLRSLSLSDRRRQRPALRNVAIAVATRKQDSNYQLRSWPLFVNFDRNLVPTTLLDLIRKRTLPFRDAFPYPTLTLNGGSDCSIIVDDTCGTPSLPNSEQCQVRVTVAETGERDTNSVVITIQRLY